MFASLFWGAYEQAGSTLNLFGDRYTRTTIFGFAFPSSWYVSVQAFFVILLAPVMGWLWLRLGKREPSSPTKFALALLFGGLAFLFLMPAARFAQAGAGMRVSPLWLVGAYFIEEIGELCLSPIGLSVVTKLAPVRIVGLMMGVWFLSNAAGNKIAGFTASLFSSMPLDRLFGIVAVVCLASGLLLFTLIRPLQRLMGDVRVKLRSPRRRHTAPPARSRRVADSAAERKAVCGNPGFDSPDPLPPGGERSSSIVGAQRTTREAPAERSGAKFGGESGIRTLGTVSRTHAFQACSLSHSDNSPQVAGTEV